MKEHVIGKHANTEMKLPNSNKEKHDKSNRHSLTAATTVVPRGNASDGEELIGVNADATGEIDLVLLVHEKLKDRMRCATEVTTTIRVSVEKESCISSALKGIIITVRG